MEAAKSKGFKVQFLNGKWEVKEAQYYDFLLQLVAENRVSINSVIERAILNAVLDLVHDGERKEK